VLTRARRLRAASAPGPVKWITVVPFFPDGMVAVIRDHPGGLGLPTGEVRSGEHDLVDASLRILLETAGFRRQTFHEFARDGAQVFAWSEGDRYHGRRPHAAVPLEIGEPDAISRLLRVSGRSDLGDLVDAAAHSYWTIDRRAFCAEHQASLERVCVASDTVEGGSGFGGPPGEWRAAREPITDAIERDGSFLDLGCANGLLMESVQRWCAERGIAVEPYGVDIAPGLVARARERLPHWADRIWLADAATWVHPQGLRFDYVHVLLDVVPRDDRAELVAHVLRSAVRSRGRLLVSHYARSTAHDRSAAQQLRGFGHAVAGESRLPPGDDHAPPTTAWLVAP
jgi:SAM-dependent methyltransferase